MKGKRGYKEVIPKPWADLSRDERWWLEELLSGRLETARRRAEGKCHKVRAKDFVVNDDD